MELIIFGATGGTGRELVNQALEQGHKVMAFVRSPEKLKISHPNLKVIIGDARKGEDAEKAIAALTSLKLRGAKHEAVISTLGTKLGQKPGCAEGVKNMIQGMKEHGVRRIVVESAYGAGDSKKGFYARFLRLTIRPLMRDKEEMERLLRESDLDWTVIRPTSLTNGKKTGSYRIGENIPVPGWPKISRADVADFMLKVVTENLYLHQSPTVSY